MTAPDVSPPPVDRLVAMQGEQVTVRTLLELFGTRVRNFKTVTIIGDALTDAGLSTAPSFATCGLTTQILLVPLAAAGEPAIGEDVAGEDGPGAMPQTSFKIGAVPTASGGVHSVLPTAALSEATHMMAANNFSQIPVISGQSDLRGVITWRSVAAMYQNKKFSTVANALEPDFPPVAEVHHELFPHLPEVVDRGYLLVRSSTGAVQGIVTTADITRRFEATAVPFFLVGEVELRLRQCLGAKLDPAAIKKVQRHKKTGDVSDLTFGEYIKLLKSPSSGSTSIDADANWQALGWAGISRNQFVHQLDGVRRVRNAIAHFDQTPLSPDVIAELRSFCALLKQLT